MLNTGLISAYSTHTLEETRADGDRWGRLVESAVGAHLANAALTGAGSVFYWRDRNREVDFVFQHGVSLTAVEVKGGVASLAQPGLAAFRAEYKHSRLLLVGGDGVALEEFLSKSVGAGESPLGHGLVRSPGTSSNDL